MTFIFSDALVLEPKSWALRQTDYEERPYNLYADGLEVASFKDSTVVDIVKRAVVQNSHCIDLSNEWASLAGYDSFVRK